MNLNDRISELNNKFNELVGKSPKTPAEMEEKELVRTALEIALIQQSQPLHDDVLEVGIRIKSVSDFVHTSEKYPEAIPILIKHLTKPYHKRIKAGIVRALSVKEAKGMANKAIVAEYRKASKDDFHFAWLFGNAMSVIVTDGDLDDLIQIVTDESNGESRTGFIEALAKIKSPTVIEVLHRLEKDKNQIVAERAMKMLARKARSKEKAKKVV